MSDFLPPSIDPVAAVRWHMTAPAASPWLHEEVGQRMQDRLQWICRTPARWVSWQPVRGGLQAHASVAQRYAQAPCHVVEDAPVAQALAAQTWAKPWWSPARWSGAATTLAQPADGSMELVWANMRLHEQANPMAMLRQWHAALAVDGFVMFSCLGPDTAQELRAVYDRLGWPAPTQSFTDMHDWGDMLVQSGFAEPVMDMERITLTFATPERLLQELRELGRNLHPQRFAGLRGRAWKQQLCQALAQELATDGPGSPLAITFEVVYGHAFKPQPKVAVSGESTVSLDQMRSMLAQPRSSGLR